MATKCKNCPLRQRPLFTDMSSEEAAFMQKFKVGELVVDPGTPILMEGSNSPQLFTVLYGMGLRYKTLPDGERQVLNFVFPGDFIGLQAGILGEMGHSAETTTRMTLCVFDRSGFWNFFRSHPERAFDVTWLAAIEEHFLGETVATVGQRSALQATAWALTRVFKQGDALGLVNDRSMKFPFTQRDLADALGLSLVHMNKTLKKLRDRQLATWSNGSLQVADLAKLAEVANVDDVNPKQRPLF